MSSKIVWSIKEITKILRERQINEFDCNIGVSGRRGNGKSTLLLKIFKSFKKEGFKQKKHQAYSQRDVTNLLATQKFGFCWDDEAINSGYKRNFQQAGQKTLVQVITNYRDNFNIYGSALPFFYSLDKDLRELIFMHFHIIERGLAVILLPLEDQIHSQDPWDTANNIKIEQKEYSRMKKDPNAKFRYPKLSTFAGYLYFGPMSKREKEIYLKIKQEKRSRNFEKTGILQAEEEEKTFRQKVFDLMMEGKISKSGLIQACLLAGDKYNNVLGIINKMLKDKGEKRSATDFFVKDEIQTNKSKDMSLVKNLVPDIPI